MSPPVSHTPSEEKHEKRKRGTGGVFSVPGSKNLHIGYYSNGRYIRESSGSPDPKVAEKKLKKQLARVETKTWTDPAELRITVDELYDRLLNFYKANGKAKALKSAMERWEMPAKEEGGLPSVRRLKEYFSGMNARRVTMDVLDAYATKYREKGFGPATINRDMSALRKAFRLAPKADKLQKIPAFPHYEEPAPKDGFIEAPDYTRVVADARELYLRVFLELDFTYPSRSDELKSLRVRQVDFVNGMIRWAPGTTKNKEGRNVAMTTAARELLIEAVRGKKPDDFVLTREGNKRVKDFRAAWRNLFIRAGLGHWMCLPCSKLGQEITVTAETCSKCGEKITSKMRSYRGYTPHDMRRSSAKEARLAGVPESTIMDMGGWKTRSVFKRYAIDSSADQRAAADKVERARAEKTPTSRTVHTQSGRKRRFNRDKR